MARLSRGKVYRIGFAVLLCWTTSAIAQSVEQPSRDINQKIDPKTCAYEGDADWAEKALSRSMETQLGLRPIVHPEDNLPSRAKILSDL